jgi:predicted nucleic acid-binding protein
VILVDANILIYSHVQSFAQHKSARDWLDQQLNGSTGVGLPWVSLRAWLACETAWIPQPTERHADLLDELLALPGVHANLVPDAHLAALAMEHGLTLCSTDGDFARFPSLRLLNPLAP